MTTMGRLDAEYRIGDASAEFVEIPDATCVCGQRIVPVLGKIVYGTTIDWTVWIKDHYEHVERPAYPHPPVPAS